MWFLSDLSAPQINLSPFTVIAIRVANLRRVKALIPTRENYPLASPLSSQTTGHLMEGTLLPLYWLFNATSMELQSTNKPLTAYYYRDHSGRP